MPIERERQGKQFHNTEHTSEKLGEQLLTTNMMGILGVFAYVINHRNTNRCMSLSWTSAWPMYHILGEQMLYINILNTLQKSIKRNKE